MSSEWPKLPLSEIAEVFTGFPFKGDKYLPPAKGVRVVRGDNVTERFLRWGDKEKCWNSVTQDLKPYLLRTGDVVIGMDGSKVGRNFAAISSKDDGSLLAQRVARVRAKNCADQDFVRYLICNPSFTQYVQSVHTGTSIPHISKGQIENFVVSVPPLNIQKSIAEILVGIDDRITLLRETNKTLEAIAQALFKSWFVDFDPVRTKMEGRQPEGMDDATAAQFPDSFEESELGEIPKGWSVLKFGEFIERLSVGKKFDQKTALVEGLVPILDQGKSGMIGFHNETPGVNASLDSPVVVFANHTCYMRLICFDFSAIQNVLPFVGKGVDTVWAFFATRDRVKFTEYKGHWPDFAIEKAVVPLKSLTDSFRSAVNPLIRRIRINELQTETLSNLRDTLLPRLISGQLRLPEAEAEIEALTA